MELRRWPRKNDPDSIRARQETVRDLTSDGEVLWDDLEPWSQANEALTGVAVVPVSVIGPLTVSLGDYSLREPDGVVEERGRSTESVEDPSRSRWAKLREVGTHVVGPMCHVLWRWTTGDAVGANMMTRNSYLLNMGYVRERSPVPIERSVLEANMGGDKKPSDQYFQEGHGKTVIAEATLTDDAVRRVLRTTVEDLLELAWAGTHGAVASGMQSVAFTPASAIAAIFAATGQDLGMIGTSSMAHGTGHRTEDGGLHAAIRFPGLEVGTVGGGTTLPYARDWLALLGCAGSGKVHRFAQIVAAAALALEISASSAMATAGSENFFQAHHERGGLR